MPKALLQIFILIFLFLGACRPPPTTPKQTGTEAGSEVSAARALFEKNLAAIQAKDREAYLACYRDSERLILAGNSGIRLGYKELASGTATAASAWPEKLEAKDVTLHPVAPGVVYGSYRYRVTRDGETTEGWSERVFVKTPKGWRIAVSTAFRDPEP